RICERADRRPAPSAPRTWPAPAYGGEGEASGPSVRAGVREEGRPGGWCDGEAGAGRVLGVTDEDVSRGGGHLDAVGALVRAVTAFHPDGVGFGQGLRVMSLQALSR